MPPQFGTMQPSSRHAKAGAGGIRPKGWGHRPGSMGAHFGRVPSPPCNLQWGQWGQWGHRINRGLQCPHCPNQWGQIQSVKVRCSANPMPAGAGLRSRRPLHQVKREPNQRAPKSGPCRRPLVCLFVCLFGAVSPVLPRKINPARRRPTRPVLRFASMASPLRHAHACTACQPRPTWHGLGWPGLKRPGRISLG